MSNNKLELEALLKNIQDGLKNFSIKELNEGIFSFLHKNSDKTIIINYVLEIVCVEFDISRATLKSKHARGEIIEAKQLAYCLLKKNLGLSYRKIANTVFFNNPNSVFIGVNKLNKADLNHKVDKNFIEKYNKLEQKLLLKFANLEKNRI